MNGKARISEDMISDRFQLNVTGEQSEGISCDGLFRPSGDTQGPFLINCKHTEGGTVATQQAAVSTGPTASGNYGVAVWLQ
ncbi:MAG: hypothetical protein ABJX32_18175 [Tateyamaria sp.]|uniref:hypothetical protein n=1 Tax=Tateyamaria sp. TaxID=1929288 RepID=UPI00329BA164